MWKKVLTKNASIAGIVAGALYSFLDEDRPIQTDKGGVSPPFDQKIVHDLLTAPNASRPNSQAPERWAVMGRHLKFCGKGKKGRSSRCENLKGRDRGGGDESVYEKYVQIVGAVARAVILPEIQTDNSSRTRGETRLPGWRDEKNNHHRIFFFAIYMPVSDRRPK